MAMTEFSRPFILHHFSNIYNNDFPTYQTECFKGGKTLYRFFFLFCLCSGDDFTVYSLNSNVNLDPHLHTTMVVK